jgi:hypothetical protein
MSAQPVPGIAYRNKTADAVKKAARQQLPSLRADLPTAFSQRLSALSAAEFPAQVADGAALSGVHRSVPEDLLASGSWTTLPGGGRVWRLALQSPDAAGVRLHFEDFHVGSGRVWIHDGSRDESEIMGAYTGDGLWDDREFWSDYVMSDTLVVEYEPAAGAGQDIPFRITALSHLLPQTVVKQLAGKSDVRKAAAEVLGRNQVAASCNLDVSCYSAWAEASRAVGHLVFEKDGSSFVCTGTLVNTRGSSLVPYFLTADHCVNTNSVARTVQTFWGYQTRSCNGTPIVRRDAQRVLGATYLGGEGASQGDFSLIRLTEAPPDAYFVGWNPAELEVGTDVTAIHHPSGEHKRISFGVNATSRTPAFYRINMSQGVVQAGSSGSAIFSSGGQLRGVLSSGPKLDDDEYCSVGTLPTNYGRFPIIYNSLRDYFEDRANSRPANPPPTTATPRSLASGTSQTFTIEPQTQAMLLNGVQSYAIRVPEGAARLEIQLVTDTPGADLDLYARFGSDVALSGAQVIADHRSDGPTGNETLTITPASTPALRAGTYFITLGVFTTSTRITGRVMATVSMTPPNTGTALTSGVSTNFSLGPVEINTLYDDSFYRIVVPEGATSLEIEVQTTTRGADVDLYASHNKPVALQSGRVVADYKSEGDAGEEKIVITSGSNPPLRPGTYYIALGLFTHRVVASGTVRATVRTAPPPPSGQVKLTSGRPQSFQFDPVNTGTLFRGDYSMIVDVPANARRLVVQVATTTADADVDLHVRYGTDTAIQNASIVADYSSEGPTGAETITITPASTPALKAGQYYISLAVFTNGKTIAGTVTATVDTGAPDRTPSPGILLTSGQASRFNLPAESEPFLHNSDRSFTIEVPSGATRLSIELQSTVPSVDVDLYVRHGEDVGLGDEGVLADFASETESGNETIVISGGSNPPLKPGTYYISLAVYTTDVGAAGMLTATVERGFAPPTQAPSAPRIDMGTPGKFSLPSVDGHTLFTGEYGYYFELPSGSGRLEVVMKTETAGADVDLYLRYGTEPEIVNGRIIADHRGLGDTGNESLAVDSRSVPPLRPGRYYVAFAQYTANIASTGDVVVRYEGPAGAYVEQPLSMELPVTGGKGRMGKATRIPNSAKYDFGTLSKKSYRKASSSSTR